MEKKIGLIILLGTLSAVLMFKSLSSDEINFLVLSDSISNNEEINFNDIFYEEYSDDIITYNNSYMINNLSSRDLYDLINFNDVISDNEYTIKQLINMSEIINISIGMDEINNHENVNIYLYYMDLVLNEIRNINDNDIYLVGLYSVNIFINNVNEQLKNLCEKYDVIFIDIEDLITDEYIIDNSYLLTNEGQILIANEFINMANK